MSKIPSYTKILTLGSAYTDNALVGEVIVQEKIDGSQLRFCINEDRKLVIGSKSTILGHPDENKMFKEAVKYLLSIEDYITVIFPTNTYFYGEYLQRPRHNVLKYHCCPTNHIVLFDVVKEGKYITNREELKKIADLLRVDCIPELYRGDVTVDKIKDLIVNTQSYLGGELIEGVVIKNYSQTICLGNQVYPLFTKYVRPAYKERHNAEWKINNPKESLADYIKGFRNENRWRKAILHLRDKGLLTTSPKDIGMLLKEIQEDILTEETENIKNYLFKTFKDDILRNSIQGFPEWYKEELLKNVKDE